MSQGCSAQGKAGEDVWSLKSYNTVFTHFGHFAHPEISQEIIDIDLETSFTLPDKGSHQKCKVTQFVWIFLTGQCVRKITQNLETILQTGFLGPMLSTFISQVGQNSAFWMIMTMMMNIKLVEASHQYCHWPHFLGAFLLDQINHISEMFFAFTSSSLSWTSASSPPYPCKTRHFLDLLSSRGGAICPQARQRCHHNICSYIGWIDKYCICQFNQYLQILRRQCCLPQAFSWTPGGSEFFGLCLLGLVCCDHPWK